MYIFILIFLSISNICYSQNDSVFVDYKVGINGAKDISNNSNITIYGGNCYLEFYNRSKYLFLDIDYNNVSSKNNSNYVKLNDDLNVIINYTHFKHKRVFVWYISRYDNIYSLDIKRRYQIGSGLGIYLIKKTNIIIDISDGLIYQFNMFSNYVNSLRFKIEFKTDLLTFKNIIYYQDSFNEDKDFIILSNSSITYKVYKNLGLELKLINNFRNIENKRNIFYTIGINLKFK
jgi:hypothetical protein